MGETVSEVTLLESVDGEGGEGEGGEIEIEEGIMLSKSLCMCQ